MDDVKDSNSAPVAEQGNLAASPEADGAAPQIDGGVDALVANLRAAKEQFEALVETSEISSGSAPQAANKVGRSAA